MFGRWTKEGKKGGRESERNRDRGEREWEQAAKRGANIELELSLLLHRDIISLRPRNSSKKFECLNPFDPDWSVEEGGRGWEEAGGDGKRGGKGCKSNGREQDGLRRRRVEPWESRGGWWWCWEWGEGRWWWWWWCTAWQQSHKQLQHKFRQQREL